MLSPPENNNTAGPIIDLLTATAAQLEHHLDDGLTSERLVGLYLDQIKKHNHFGMRLNALITSAPDDIFDRARALDEERRTTGKRSSLHGIPIIVKV